MWIRKLLSALSGTPVSPAPEEALNTAEDDSGDYRVISPSEARLKYTAGPFFLSSEESIEIHGYCLSGPLFVCDRPSAARQTNPVVVYASLPITHQLATNGIGQWPSYSAISPEHRNGFLRWLSSSRGETPELGYPFLYLGAMEYFVHEWATSIEKGQRERILDSILDELERLISIFSDNRNFVGFAGSLVEAIYFHHRLNEPDSFELRFPGLIHNVVRHVIAVHGQKAPTASVPVEWAFQWALLETTIPYKDRMEAFPAFKERYANDLQGITLGGFKSKLAIQPDTPSYDQARPQKINFPQHIDYVSQVRTTKLLVGVIDDITQHLFTHTTLTDEMSPIDILKAGQKSAVDLSGNNVFNASIGCVENVLSTLEVQTYRNVVEYFQLPLTRDINTLTAGTTNYILELAGHCIIPNSDHINYTPRTSDPCLLLPVPHVANLSLEGQNCLMIIRLVHMTLFKRNNTLEQRAQSALLVRAGRELAPETEILAGYVTWCSSNPVMNRGMDASNIPEHDDGSSLHSDLVSVLAEAADVTQPLVKRFTKALSKMEVPSWFSVQAVEQLNTHIPTRKSHANLIEGEIPEPSNFVLNRSLIEQHQIDTHEVQSILADIFEADTDPSTSKPDTQPEIAQVEEDMWFGHQLQGEQAAIASWLVQFEEVALSDVEAKCKAHALPVDGTLESINDAAYDILGDALIEIDDPVIIYRDLLESEEN